MGYDRLPRTAAPVEFRDRLRKTLIGSQELGNSGKLEPDQGGFSESGVAPEKERPKPQLPKIIDNTKREGALIALMLSKSDAAKLAVTGGDSPESLHITLAFLGKAEDIDDNLYEIIGAAVAKAIADVDKIDGKVAGYGRFSGEDHDSVYALFDSPQIDEIREKVIAELNKAGVEVDKTHGFVPHINLATVKSGSPDPVDGVQNIELSFDTVSVVSNEFVEETINFGTKTRHRRRRRTIQFSENGEVDIKKVYEMWVRSEGGIHTHKLVRDKKKTGQDGAHRHMFLKENGAIMITEDDGAHEHGLADEMADETGDETNDHTHIMEMFDGTLLETEAGSAHTHEALVNSTAGDGQHTHDLVLPDDTRLNSMTGAEFWRFRQEQLRRFREEEEMFRRMNEEQSKSETTKSDENPVYTATILKLDDEQRLVTGIVLEPDEVDAQNDTISPEVIEEAAHKFLAKFNRTCRLGIMHNMFGEIGVNLVESFITRETSKVSGNKVKKGSWIITIKVLDDLVWKKIKDGDITGFSIGGTATIV